MKANNSFEIFNVECLLQWTGFCANRRNSVKLKKKLLGWNKRNTGCKWRPRSNLRLGPYPLLQRRPHHHQYTLPRNLPFLLQCQREPLLHIQLPLPLFPVALRTMRRRTLPVILNGTRPQCFRIYGRRLSGGMNICQTKASFVAGLFQMTFLFQTPPQRLYRIRRIPYRFIHIHQRCPEALRRNLPRQ